LVAVEHGEVAAHPLVARWSNPAAVVAVRRFYLDHIGAEISQHLRRVRTKHHRRQIDDADTIEWARLRLHVYPSRRRSHAAPPPCLRLCVYAQLCQRNSCALRCEPRLSLTLTSAGPLKFIASSSAPRRSFGSST